MGYGNGKSCGPRPGMKKRNTRGATSQAAVETRNAVAGERMDVGRGRGAGPSPRVATGRMGKGRR